MNCPHLAPLEWRETAPVTLRGRTFELVCTACGDPPRDCDDGNDWAE